MEDNVRFLNQLDKLLKQKTEDYGSFDRTSWVMTQFLENILTAHNGAKVKVSIKIFGITPHLKVMKVSKDSPLDIESVKGWYEHNLKLAKAYRKLGVTSKRVSINKTI